MELYSKTDIEILKSLGRKIREIRLSRNISQYRLATLAGVSLRRVGDVESGSNHSVLILVQILRALGSLELLSKFFEQRQLSPIEYAKIQRNESVKQRISKKIDGFFIFDEEEDEKW